MDTWLGNSDQAKKEYVLGLQPSNLGHLGGQISHSSPLISLSVASIIHRQPSPPSPPCHLTNQLDKLLRLMPKPSHKQPIHLPPQPPPQPRSRSTPINNPRPPP